MATALSMVNLYVIKSLTKKYCYVGITNNLERRLLQHNSGRNFATKGFVPFKLIYAEEFDKMKDARKREIFLKSGAGRKYLDSLQS